MSSFYKKKWGTCPFKQRQRTNRVFFFIFIFSPYSLETLWSVVLGTAAAASWPHQHFREGQQHKARLAEYWEVWEQDGSSTAERQRCEQMMNICGLLGCFREGELQLKITCLPDPWHLLGTVLSSGLREKSIRHSAMPSSAFSRLTLTWPIWTCVWFADCAVYVDCIYWFTASNLGDSSTV